MNHELHLVLESGFDIPETITLISAIAAAVIGIANILLTVHRSHIESITRYRKEWISEVRESTATVLSGKKEYAIQEIEKLILYLNPSKSHALDQDIVRLLDFLKNSYILLSGRDSQELRINFQSRDLYLISDIRKRMHVYLKMEWTRVKYESSIIKISYHYCWKRCLWPWSGFDEEKAIKKIQKEYGYDLSKYNAEYGSLEKSDNKQEQCIEPPTT